MNDYECMLLLATVIMLWKHEYRNNRPMLPTNKDVVTWAYETDLIDLPEWSALVDYLFRNNITHWFI